MVQRRPYPSRSGFFGVLMLSEREWLCHNAVPGSGASAHCAGCHAGEWVSAPRRGEGVIARAVGGRRWAYDGQCPDGDADKAVAQGGNVVLVTQNNANTYGTWLYGEAYRCPPQ